MQKMRVQVMLPLDAIQALNTLTQEWRMRSVGQTIEELLHNYAQISRRYNECQKNLDELRGELLKWRDLSNESKAMPGTETSSEVLLS